MLNYIKSELFRIIHTKEIYKITLILSALLVFMNTVLFLFGRYTPDFPYNLVSFSLNELIGNLNWLMLAGLMVVSFLYSEERKNETLKNSIAYGISRQNIYLGKCVVSVISCVASLIVILIFYVGSAALLLDGPVAEPLFTMLSGIGAAFLIAVASITLSITLYSICKKEIYVVLIWFGIMFLIPMVSFFLGLKIELFNKVAEWMPWNFLKYEVVADMSGYNCLWDTPTGLWKCILSGVAGIVIFTAAGLIAQRRKSID